MLEKIEQEIRDEYKRLGYNQSWTFLGSNKNSFHKGQKILFVGLNPGGKKIEPSSANFPYRETLYCFNTNEKDNSYNVYLDASDWTETGEKNPLQLQVIDLYKKLYKKIEAINPQVAHENGHDYEDFMRKSLVLNYTPFRSSNWNALTQKSDALAFSDRLWKDYIFRDLYPLVIITMNQIAYDQIKKIFEVKGYCSQSEQGLNTGWGNITYNLTKLTKVGMPSVSLARCPHLSRYKLFNTENKSYLEFQENFISFLATSLSEMKNGYSTAQDLKAQSEKRH